jgi:hypothetical protein
VDSAITKGMHVNGYIEGPVLRGPSTPMTALGKSDVRSYDRCRVIIHAGTSASADKTAAYK